MDLLVAVDEKRLLQHLSDVDVLPHSDLAYRLDQSANEWRIVFNPPTVLFSSIPTGSSTQQALRNAQDARERALRRLMWAWRKRTKARLRDELAAIDNEIARLEPLAAEERARREQWLKREAERQEQLEQASQRGRAVLQRLVPDIRTALCERWGACEKVKRYQDQTALGMAIADVLATVVTAAPVATVSALVVKMGVKKFCDCPSE
jgi:hypothetical protein